MTPSQVSIILTPGRKYNNARVYIAGKYFEGEVLNTEDYEVKISRGSYTARVPVESILAIEVYTPAEIKVTLY